MPHTPRLSLFVTPVLVANAQCGGPKTLICETGPWTLGSKRSDSGWLDVKVVIETFGVEGANEVVELVLPKAYYYYGVAYQYAPTIRRVAPHAASAEDAITVSGKNLGYWLQDYRQVYVGGGRPDLL